MPKDDLSAPIILKPSKQHSPRHSHSFSAPSAAKPKPSTLLSKLSDLKNKPQKQVESYEDSRTDSFLSKAKPCKGEVGADIVRTPLRDDRLAIIADLRPGPYDHKAPADDHLFQRLEPHSGIYLSKRSLSHEDLQEYLTGRYYISPSMLYSVIRLLPNNQGYDVPVVGDWVTIAVVAERGPVRISRGPTTADRSELHENDSGDESFATPTPQGPQPSKTDRKTDPPPKSTGRKYVNLKLIDFGARSRGSEVGGKATIRGDAFLSMLLFEADRKEKAPREGGGLPETVYKGGSKGAFERMATMPEGAVVALLNPRVLKPFNKSNDKPHPTSNILALTPDSIKSVIVIGHARDLGRCDVRKKDGNICGGWYDKRISSACEFHVQNAVERRRNARPEFTASTSTMSHSSKKTKKTEFDPARKWGLQPESGHNSVSTDSGGATYVVGGHVVNDKRNLFLSENIGREAQARAQRLSKKDTDRQLKSLLDRDREGMQHVELAREHARKLRQANRNGCRKEKPDKGESKESVDAVPADSGKEPGSAQAAYSAEVIQKLGFDPTLNRLGHRSALDQSGFHAQLNRLASQRVLKDIALGPRPGTRHRTSVRPPPQALRAPQDPQGEPDMGDSGFGQHAPSPQQSIIYLDSSDNELGFDA
ncbi:hypothetical protein K488DRAFT_85447 [Vararia minispora EC-137]|uniref:Uncharacterized protein n=1 Tax=Vararia minispora EC-137 TaxID=1314806 RepID=A0ACB8QM61_9AGAM|nr:hypothetical protein K488DRAFT_85447 [Vararia minispora EC-137]